MRMRRRRDRARFERWRTATELTDDERAAGLPVIPTFEAPPIARPRPRRPPAETDRNVLAASMSRATHIRHAHGFTAAAVAMSAVLPYGVAASKLTLVVAGVPLLLIGLTSAYIAIGVWSYLVTGELREPSKRLLRLGRAVDRALNRPLGRR